MDLRLLQTQLSAAFSQKDIVDFEVCLDMGADALNLDFSNECIYEKALATYGCAEFVDKCLKNGCSPNYINPITSKAAINCAAASGDPEILQKLLKYPNLRVNHKFMDQTAMHILIRQIDSSNKENIMASVQLMLSYGASPLLADEKGMTSIQYVMKNSVISQDVKNKLIEVLESNSNTLRDDVMQSSKLFIDSIVEKDFKTFDGLLINGFDPNIKFNNKAPLDFALAVGNYCALKKLLGHPNIDLNCDRNGSSPLMEILKNWKDSDSFDYRKCFYLLLTSNDIDVNAKDERELTALHYAAEHHNVDAMRELLKRGAFIGARSLSNILAVEGVPAEVLQECLDNCITSNGFEQNDQPNFGIAMSYENLMPKLEQLQERKFDEDLVAIKFIANSEKHRHLLEHPVISSFLELKWNQLSFMFYASFLMYLLFAISMYGYIIGKFCGHQQQQSTLTLDIFWVLSWAGIICMILKELIQMLNERWEYFRSFSNYIELTMIALAVWTCSPAFVDHPHQRAIAVTTILLISMEIFMLTGSVPMYSMTKHMLMFEAVSKSFLKSFMLYAIFFITFSLCFYILFGAAAQEAPEQVPTDFNRFSTPLGSMVKTIVMLTGEFDAGSIEFSTGYSYMLFLLYVFLMTIVLYNLLNGLAVSDIQAIQGQAEQQIIISRINLIRRYGKVLAGHSEKLSFSVNLNRYQHLYGRFMKLYVHKKNAPNHQSSSDIENLIHQKNVVITEQRIIEKSIDILEQKSLNAIKQKHIRSCENRLNDIESKLKNICELLKDTRERKPE